MSTAEPKPVRHMVFGGGTIPEEKPLCGAELPPGTTLRPLEEVDPNDVCRACWKLAWPELKRRETDNNKHFDEVVYQLVESWVADTSSRALAIMGTAIANAVMDGSGRKPITLAPGYVKAFEIDLGNAEVWGLDERQAGLVAEVRKAYQASKASLPRAHAQLQQVPKEAPHV